MSKINTYQPTKNKKTCFYSHSMEEFVEENLENYEILYTIGTGTFSQVKLGIHKQTKEYVAVKIISKNRITDKNELSRIKREMSILKKLNHPNIIKIFEIIENENKFYFIMEYATGGELYNYIVSKNVLSENESANFFCQLICGIEYIHKKGISHRDIKPENILLKNDNKIIAITDFGLSNNYSNETPLLKTTCGSPNYTAPEILMGSKYNGVKIDIWSSGVLLFAMVCGYLPFENPNVFLLYNQIKKGDFILPENLSENCKDLIKKILDTNPESRIDINGIKKHPFLINYFKNYNPQNYLILDKKKIDNNIIDLMVKKFNFSRSKIIDSIKNNLLNNFSTTYTLLINRKKKKEFSKNKKNNNFANKPTKANKKKNLISLKKRIFINLYTEKLFHNINNDKTIKKYNQYLTKINRKSFRANSPQLGISFDILNRSLKNYSGRISLNNILPRKNNFTPHNIENLDEIEKKLLKNFKKQENYINYNINIQPQNNNYLNEFSNKNNKNYLEHIPEIQTEKKLTNSKKNIYNGQYKVCNTENNSFYISKTNSKTKPKSKIKINNICKLTETPKTKKLINLKLPLQLSAILRDPYENNNLKKFVYFSPKITKSQKSNKIFQNSTPKNLFSNQRKNQLIRAESPEFSHYLIKRRPIIDNIHDVKKNSVCSDYINIYKPKNIFYNKKIIKHKKIGNNKNIECNKNFNKINVKNILTESSENLNNDYSFNETDDDRSNFQKDFVFFNSYSSVKKIYSILLDYCNKNNLFFIPKSEFIFICKDLNDNSVKVEITRKNKTNLVKISHESGNMNANRELIKKILVNICF